MNDPRPWTVLAERNVRDFKVFRTRTLDVADPRSGLPYVRTVIDSSDWVNVIPVTTDGNIVLVRQFRFGSWSNSLEIPGGLVDPGEDPRGAAERELLEETGYRAASLVPVGTCNPNPALFSNRLHSYLATGCERVHDGQPEPSEDIVVELVSRQALRALVLDGTVDHALVLVALLFEAWGPAQR